MAALVYIVGNTIFLVWGSAKEQSWNRGSGAAGGLSEEEDNEDDPYLGICKSEDVGGAWSEPRVGNSIELR